MLGEAQEKVVAGMEEEEDVRREEEEEAEVTCQSALWWVWEVQ